MEEIDTSKLIETKNRALSKVSVKDPLMVCKHALEDMKAHKIKIISLVKRNTYTDNLIIATGTSNTHVHSIAGRVADNLVKSGHIIDSMEGSPNNQWVIIDAGDVVVHVFNEETRALYNIEKLYIDIDDDDNDDTPFEKTLSACS